MIISKRHAEMLQLLEKEGTLEISDLAQRFDVSLETIRRDLKPLADAGRVIKLHGAVALPGPAAEEPFQKRMRENSEAKRAIGRAFARSVRDGDTLMLDTGTTTSFVARELARHRQLTVITNSTDIARTLGSINGNRVFIAGGEIRGDSGAALGASTVAYLAQFTVKHAVISASAISADSGITDHDMAEADIARAILSCGERKIAVADSSKFQKRGLVQVCPLSGITDLVTEMPPPAQLNAVFVQSGVTVTVAR
jgi:DeoR family glycerol-3-phosphate regulon repressor